MTDDDERKLATETATRVLPDRIGRVIRARIISLRIAAGDSARLNAELDELVEEVLRLANAWRRDDYIQDGERHG